MSFKDGKNILTIESKMKCGCFGHECVPLDQFGNEVNDVTEVDLEIGIAKIENYNPIKMDLDTTYKDGVTVYCRCSKDKLTAESLEK